jgi:hypothetical protein
MTNTMFHSLQRMGGKFYTIIVKYFTQKFLQFHVSTCSNAFYILPLAFNTIGVVREFLQIPTSIRSHYEKLCPWQLDYLTTKVPKQLICNCIATVPWKYDKLINKMSRQKFTALYCSYKMYVYTIQCTHCIYGYSQPCLTLLTSCTLIACNNYITIRINLITNQ